MLLIPGPWEDHYSNVVRDLSSGCHLKVPMRKEGCWGGGSYLNEVTLLE